MRILKALMILALLTLPLACKKKASPAPAAPAPVPPAPTATSTATSTPTSSSTLTVTATPTPTATFSPTVTQTPTETPSPTETRSPTPTGTPTFTHSPTPINTATPNPTPPSASITWTLPGVTNYSIAASGAYIFVGAYPDISVFTLAGAPVTSFNNGTFPRGLTPDGSGGVYATSAGGMMVRRVTSTFVNSTAFSISHSSNGIARDFGGNIYVTDGQGTTHRVYKYNSAGVSITSWTVPGGNPWGIAIAGSPQTVFVASSAAQSIFTYDTAGNALGTQWAIASQGTALAVDGLGRIYAGGSTTNASNLAQRFSLDGTFQTQWGPFLSQGMAVDDSNKVYVDDGTTMRSFNP